VAARGTTKSLSSLLTWPTAGTNHSQEDPDAGEDIFRAVLNRVGPEYTQTADGNQYILNLLGCHPSTIQSIVEPGYPSTITTISDPGFTSQGHATTTPTSEAVSQVDFADANVYNADESSGHESSNKQSSVNAAYGSSSEDSSGNERANDTANQLSYMGGHLPDAQDSGLQRAAVIYTPRRGIHPSDSDDNVAHRRKYRPRRRGKYLLVIIQRRCN